MVEKGRRLIGLAIAVVNFGLIMMEVVLLGMGIREVRKALQQEPSDGTALIFSCRAHNLHTLVAALLTLPSVVIFAEIIGNIFLLFGIRKDMKPKVMVYIGVCVVVTFLSTVGLIVLNLISNFSNTELAPIFCFWTLRIVYTFVSTFLIWRTFLYGSLPYDLLPQPSNQKLQMPETIEDLSSKKSEIKRIQADETPKPYSCDICNKAFRLETQMRDHRLIHMGEKPFKCPDCGRGFRQFGTLRVHKILECEIMQEPVTSIAQVSTLPDVKEV